MNNSVAVNVVQSLRNVVQGLQDDWQGLSDQGRRWLAREQFHRKKRPRIRLSIFVNLQAVWMLDRGDGTELPGESLSRGSLEMCLHHLNGDLATSFDLFRKKHGRHTTVAQLTNQPEPFVQD